MSEELKPCPFCNSSNLHRYQNAPSSDMQTTEHVACLNCGCGQSTVAAWNRRAAAQPVPATGTQPAPAAVPADIQRDAERYRWLRSVGAEQQNVIGHYAEAEMDKMVDKHMAAAPQQAPTGGAE